MIQKPINLMISQDDPMISWDMTQESFEKMFTTESNNSGDIIRISVIKLKKLNLKRTYI